MGGQLAKYLPSFFAGLDRSRHPLPGDPASDRNRRAATDAFKALLHKPIDFVAWARGAGHGQAEHIARAYLQRLAKAREVVPALTQCEHLVVKGLASHNPPNLSVVQTSSTH